MPRVSKTVAAYTKHVGRDVTGKCVIDSDPAVACEKLAAMLTA